MPIKKTVKKEDAHKKETPNAKGKYFYAIGRRKTAIAQIKLYVSKEEKNIVIANGKTAEAYFPTESLSETAKSPLTLIGDEKKFEAVVKISGGGMSAQADAIRLGVARALVVFDETLKKTFKDVGFLTRDPREVERKKPGLKKARKAPQWAKR